MPCWVGCVSVFFWIENHGYGRLFWMRGKDQLNKTFYAAIFRTRVWLLPCLSVSNAFANPVDVCKRFVKVVSGICQSCNTDLSMLLHAFVKVGIWICQVLTCISCPNQTMLMFDQDFKGRCRICLCCSAERTMSVENVQFLTDGINFIVTKKRLFSDRKGKTSMISGEHFFFVKIQPSIFIDRTWTAGPLGHSASVGCGTGQLFKQSRFGGLIRKQVVIRKSSCCFFDS